MESTCFQEPFRERPKLRGMAGEAASQRGCVGAVLPPLRLALNSKMPSHKCSRGRIAGHTGRFKREQQ